MFIAAAIGLIVLGASLGGVGGAVLVVAGVPLGLLGVLGLVAALRALGRG